MPGLEFGISLNFFEIILMVETCKNEEQENILKLYLTILEFFLIIYRPKLSVYVSNLELFYSK